MEKIKVLAFAKDNMGVGKFRTLDPHMYLQKHYDSEFDIHINEHKELSGDRLSKFDILHFNTRIALKTKAILEKARKHRIKISMDIDDYWEDNQETINLMRSADCVTTTTKNLAKEIEKINPNVKVLPNAIDLEEEQFKSNCHVENSIGWLGGNTHLRDLQLLTPSLEKIRDDDSLSNVTVVLAGHTPEFSKTLSCDGSIKRFKSLRFQPINNYAVGYDHFNIALIPLRSSKFNSMKSPLKIIEAGFHRKIVIASKVKPYTDDLVHGTNAWLIDETDEYGWYKAIKFLLANTWLANTIANNLYNYVTTKYSLSRISKSRAEFYKNLYYDR